jgi:hypothetical protein
VRYVIYADESIKEGPFFSSFYGAALVRGHDLSYVEGALNRRKAELNLLGEVKWSKISEAYRDKYLAIVNTLFDLIEEDRIKVRIMFRQNLHRPLGLRQDQAENRYALLYYQLLKHAFGLQYSRPPRGGATVQILLDQLPMTRERRATFKAFLANLTQNPQFREAGITIPLSEIGEVDSANHVVLQGLDVILGAMQFRLNDGHKAKPAEARIRGSRTRAKETVYKEILRRVQGIHPRFNIGISTAGRGEDRWVQPYRHWLFVPREHEFDSRESLRKVGR